MSSRLSPLAAIDAIEFPSLYEELLWRTFRNTKHEELNERTGKRVRTFPGGGTAFSLDLRRNQVPVVGRRKLFPHVAAAEVAWYMLGTQHAAFIMRHAPKLWSKFLEEPTAHTRMPDPLPGFDDDLRIVKSAYGYRWRSYFGRDQLGLAIDALRANPSDRRVYVSAWDPAQDGLGAKGQLNVPCPVGFSLAIIEGRLCSTLTLRSSDLFVGLPYDVMGHAMLMACVACSLANTPLGTMTVVLAHPHLYESHFDLTEEFLKQGPVPSMVPLVHRPVNWVSWHADEFVADYRERQRRTEWPSYCPLPEVVL